MNENLKPVEKEIAIKVEAAVDPKEFFQDRKGLWVWGDFTKRIVEKAEPTPSGTEFKLASFQLTKYLSDEEIEAALPKEHIFSETEVSAILASLISKQSKGEEGALLNNGNWNLFYTPAFVVFVYWDSGSSDWSVGSWRRDGRRWYEGHRVFSPATVS